MIPTDLARNLGLLLIFSISLVIASCAILSRGAHAQFTPPSVQYRGPLPTTIGDCAVFNSTNGQYITDIGACPGTAAISVLKAWGFNPVLTGPVLTLSFDPALASGIVKNSNPTGTALIATDCVDTYSTACFSGLLALQPSNNVAITGGTITGMPSPTASTDVATKGYVDSTELALNPATAAQAATIAVLPNTPVYNNGFSGVGATLTAGTTGALVIDGYTVHTTDRILVKDQASTFQNGLYTVSNAGSAGTFWVLARAVNFDTIYNINAAGLTPIYNGTVNGGSQWTITSTVATVGTDPITFTQYGFISPSSSTNGAVVLFDGTTGKRAKNGVAPTTTVNGTACALGGSCTVASSGVSRLDSQTVSAGNGADTTEDTLQSYTLPANTLVSNGQSIRITAWGSGVLQSGTSRTLRIYFGTTPICVMSVTQNSIIQWHFIATVTRTGSSAQVQGCLGSIVGPSVTSLPFQTGITNVNAQTDTSTILIKVTGQSTGSLANSITQLSMVTEFLP